MMMNIKNYMNSQQNTKNNLIDLFVKKGDVDTLISLGINIDDIIFSLVYHKRLDEINYIYNYQKSSLNSIFICLSLFGHSDKIKHFYTISNSGIEQLNIIASAAALNSYYDIVNWALLKGANNIEKIMCNFAYAGTVDIAQELLGIEFKTLNIDKIAKNAAKSGNKKLVDSLIEQGAKNYLYIASGAAECGHFDIVLDLYNRHKKSYFDSLLKIAVSAAKGGHVKILEWALNSFIKREEVKLIVKKAIKHKQLYIIEWLINNDYFNDVNYLIMNCNGNYDIIKLGIEYGADNLDDLTKYAIIEQREDILKLIDLKCNKNTNFPLAKYVLLTLSYINAYNPQYFLISFISTFMCLFICFKYIKDYYRKRPSYKIILEIITALIYFCYLYLVYILSCLLLNKKIVFIPELNNDIFTVQTLYISIFTPIVEETIFRLLAQKELDKYFVSKIKNKMLSYLISSILGVLYFAYMHGEMAWRVLPASIMVMLIFRYTRGGIISGIVFHMLYNLSVTIYRIDLIR